MTRSQRTVCVGLFLTTMATASLAQKVKVGYDKSVDFSKYKTYTWAPPGMPPTRPFLYEAVVGTVDSELTSKGLKRTEKDGDLTLFGAGGIDFAISFSAGSPVVSSYSGTPPMMNSSVWTGGEGAGDLMAPVPDGTLRLEFVDRGRNQIVWSGSVKQSLDIQKKEKSLKLASNAVVKLLNKFPPGSHK